MSKRKASECIDCVELQEILVNCGTFPLYKCSKEARLNKAERWAQLEKPKDCVKQ